MSALHVGSAGRRLYMQKTIYKTIYNVSARPEARYHPLGESTFHPTKRTLARTASVPTDEAFKPPRPDTNVAEFIYRRETCTFWPNGWLKMGSFRLFGVPIK